jgi:hypothetical protein
MKNLHRFWKKYIPNLDKGEFEIWSMSEFHLQELEH